MISSLACDQVSLRRYWLQSRAGITRVKKLTIMVICAPCKIAADRIHYSKSKDHARELQSLDYISETPAPAPLPDLSAKTSLASPADRSSTLAGLPYFPLFPWHRCFGLEISISLGPSPCRPVMGVEDEPPLCGVLAFVTHREDL